VSHGDQTTPLTTDVPGDLGEEGEEYSELTPGMWNSLKSVNTNWRDHMKIQWYSVSDI
jgi:hypothetical protein